MFRKHLLEGRITVQALPDGIELEDRYGEITRLAEQSIEQLDRLRFFPGNGVDLG